MHFPQDNVPAPLYVLTCVFNAARFKQRWKLYRDFQARIRQSGAILVTIEAAFGAREFAITQHAPSGSLTHSGAYQSHGPAPVPAAASLPECRDGQDYIKVRVNHQQEIWLKENLLNIALRHLPADARYVAFIDADVMFVRPDWVSETLHKLQHYDVVQMFSVATNVGPDYQPLDHSMSFGYCWVEGLASQQRMTGYGYPEPKAKGTTSWWHPGYCWAWRISALNKVGGLIEHAILGAADNHMAQSLVGCADYGLNTQLSAGYKRRVKAWEKLAVERLKMNVGYVDGTLIHFFHGRTVNRRYLDRWKIIIKHKYDPDHDLIKDRNGVIELVDSKPGLRDDIRKYFRQRNEDDIHLPLADYKLISPKPSMF